MHSVALVPNGNFLLQPTADGDSLVGLCNWQHSIEFIGSTRGDCGTQQRQAPNVEMVHENAHASLS